MRKFYYSIVVACTALLFIGPRAAAQDGQPAAASALNSVRLPAGALRVDERSVPGEIRETLTKLVSLGGEKVRQGGSEVLVWTSGFRQSNRGQFARKFTESLQAGGWTYAVGEENPEFTVFNSINSADRRTVIGFWTAKDDFVMLAWTEMLSLGTQATVAALPATYADEPSTNTGSAKVITAEKNALWVNVM